MKKKILKIGVSRCDNRFDEYLEYFNSSEFDVEIIEFYYKDKKIKNIAGCDGIIFTGGVDVHPELYGKEKQINLCGSDLNKERDIFEVELLGLAIMQRKPIFGICRGLQIVNSSPFFGGSLLCDIKHEIPDSDIIHTNGSLEGVKHPIFIEKKSILYKISNSESGEVNSFHHQSVDKIGKGFKVGSYAPDGVIESLERKEDKLFPFVFLVQWHPERMSFDSPQSGGILNNFYRYLKEQN